MLRALILALQASGAVQDSTRPPELIFNIQENYRMPKDSMRITDIDPITCLSAQTVYPIIAAIPILEKFGRHPQKMKVQECFILNTDLRGKIIVVTYSDDDRALEFPVAFVYATAREDTAHSDGRRIYAERHGFADRGFIEKGKPNRSWLSLFPAPKKTIRNQLETLLKKGYDKAKKVKK